MGPDLDISKSFEYLDLVSLINFENEPPPVKLKINDTVVCKKDCYCGISVMKTGQMYKLIQITSDIFFFVNLRSKSPILFWRGDVNEDNMELVS